ncbi:hypothetical protein SAMN05444920_15515 [Nonomuraea solani]|uniref:Resolvase/invertase-type recombinase catalytic domain-containing protein n=1 Tax=Nonomuraea solani TaxID=1144553 RepID=A0A1H6F4W5_9ACTN|nr:hypothetical protein SAMN05444920_15515 [Nonomuraea solani]
MRPRAGPPSSSKNWQLSQSRALIEPHGGEIVAKFFDVDKSRSIPPYRRPHAAALLVEPRNPARGFDAVVVGEPQRTFCGNQFGLIFPLFEHFAVPLWVPEIGGPSKRPAESIIGARPSGGEGVPASTERP